METMHSDTLAGLPHDAVTQIWNGALREELGLDAEDLQIALGVANMKQKVGDDLSALRMYMALSLCEPRNCDFLQGLANQTLKMSLYDAALQAGSAMIALKPADPFGYYFSGSACMALGHIEEGREDIGDALTFATAVGNETLARECRRLLQQLETMKSA